MYMWMGAEDLKMKKGKTQKQISKESKELEFLNTQNEKQEEKPLPSTTPSTEQGKWATLTAAKDHRDQQQEPTKDATKIANETTINQQQTRDQGRDPAAIAEEQPPTTNNNISIHATKATAITITVLTDFCSSVRKQALHKFA